ncbi:MAG: SWIM zinc finger family protein [Moraxellaceae bacterium]|nr:SWIM zinc finger family protein [Moraxellaceae bacterium]
MTTLNNLLSQKKLQEYADYRSFERGLSYFEQKQVSVISSNDNKISANVSGTRIYQTSLWGEGRYLESSCTCEAFDDNGFCKHCVAVGLAWLAGVTPTEEEDHIPNVITQYVQQLSQQKLVDIVLQQAAKDQHLLQQLLLSSHSLLDSNTKLANYKKLIVKLAVLLGDNLNDYMDYYGEYLVNEDIISQVQQFLDSLTLQINDHPADVLALCEYAFEELYINNQDTELSECLLELDEQFTTLAELHCQAALIVKPEPIALAEKLFNYQIECDRQWFDDILTNYQQALGVQGCAHYTKLVEQAWQHYLNTRKPNENTSSESKVLPNQELLAAFGKVFSTKNIVCYDKNHTLQAMMEELAESENNMDKLVSIKSQTLNYAGDYLAIAKCYEQANLPEQAIAWAEQGFYRFYRDTDGSLRDYLIAHYLKTKQQAKAICLAWLAFEERPSLAKYQTLKEVSSQFDDWLGQRQRALALIEHQVKQPKKTVWHSVSTYVDLLIDIALWENDLELAMAYSQKGEFSKAMGIKLADVVSQYAPSFALALYKKHVNQLVPQTNNQAYEEAFKLVLKVGNILKQQKQTLAFSDYVAELSVNYKLKRNFMAMLKKISIS